MNNIFIILKSIAKQRKEMEKSLPKSCVRCKYRSVDGAPEGHPICIHPLLKTQKAQYIIDFFKKPPASPKKCPKRKNKNERAI